MNLDIGILIRILLYFWTSLESLLLAYLYHFGYYKIKSSNIIGSLTAFFALLGIYFLFLSVLTFTLLFSPQVRDILLYFSIIPMIGVIIMLRQFRHWSLNQKD
jgi:hypothetical protein